MNIPRTLTAALIGACLTACGGGGLIRPDARGSVAAHAVRIDTAAGPTQDRLRCYKGDATFVPECDLRLYQVMVESFIDGDPAADHGAGFGTSHHRGDLQGVIDSLDYIKSLGVNAIWLTPIFHSIPDAGQPELTTRLDATGYFASDYFAIDPRFGTLEQAKTLVEEAHKRGLYVFLDGVFGHYKHNIVPSPGGRLPSGRSHGGVFNNIDEVDYPESLAFFKEVAAYWVKELKIDGWRLDVAYQIPIEYWDDLRDAVRQASKEVTYVDARGATVHPLGYMVAEIWDGSGERLASAGFGTDAAPALDSAFDFPQRYGLVQTLAAQENLSEPWATKQPASKLNYGFDRFGGYPAHAMPNLMIGNHDLVRFGDLIQRAGYPGPDDESYWKRHEAAFSFLAAYSGPVTIYYGDEIGQEVPGFAAPAGEDCVALGHCDDHVARSSGKVSGLSPREAALKDYVAGLMRLRAAEPALSAGSRTHLYSDEVVYVDLKTAGSSRVLYLLNVGTRKAVVTLDAAVLPSAETLEDMLTRERIGRRGAEYEIELPPLGGRLLKF